MRLIDADKLKKHYAWWGDESASEEMKENKKIFDTIIGMQPTVEAEPIRRGKWIPLNEKDCKCSVCGKIIFTSGYDKTGKALIAKATNPYCRFCGAKMDGKENEE